MKVYVVVALLCVAARAVQGAGRAIPIATENFVIDLFQRFNSRIEYDPTNYLVDLSGQYADCDFVGLRFHQTIADRTPQGQSIGAIQDYTSGRETHTQAVDSYLRPVFDSWLYENAVFGAVDQIRSADRFGCSVRPGCDGQLSVACLFSPSSGRNPRTTRPPQPPPRSTIPPFVEQNAKAFTEQQYDEAEGLTGQTWDRSHFLENLSGFETRCKMIFTDDHKFEHAKDEALKRGQVVTGLYGWARNKGTTPEALREILLQMQRIDAKHVGCSLIPDCRLDDGSMWVVVSCVFEI